MESCGISIHAIKLPRIGPEYQVIVTGSVTNNKIFHESNRRLKTAKQEMQISTAASSQSI